MNKADIASVLTEIGTLLELKGENPFKTRAYVSGARTIEGLAEEDLAKRVAEGTLQEVKGIGEALAQKITELHTTGKLEFFEKLKASVPPGLTDILSIPGMGPKKVRALQDKLGVDTIDKLRAACGSNQVAELEGFGAKTQEKILAGIRNREAYGKRHLWIEAAMAAAPILEGLRKLTGVQQAESCGSMRRRMETVGDIDFLVATTEPGPIVDWFVAQAGIKEVTAKGDLKASIRLESGLQADLRLVPPDQFVFALHHLTGSKDHNVQMRQRALDRGLSMSEWGLFPSDEKHGATAVVKKQGGDGPKSLPAKTEADLFKALGLAFIPPELREGQGEIEAAEIGGQRTENRGQTAELASSPQVSGLLPQPPSGHPLQSASGHGSAMPSPPLGSVRSQVSSTGLPVLVEETDIRGVFHNHTTASDGHNTLEEMVAATQALGLDYLGIADHSKSSVQARGLSEERLTAQIAEIQKFNASKKFKCHVFTGTECDILPDGKLDFDQGILAQLDYTVVSIHSSFRQERDVMTKRIIRALEQPHVTMLGHLTGRLLLEREGYDVDAEKVIDAAIANGVAIELNANPWRLDMDWRLWRKAAGKGLLTSINPDAHRTEQLAFFKIGVGVARKGWLTKESVLTARSLAEIKKYLAAKR